MKKTIASVIVLLICAVVFAAGAQISQQNTIEEIPPAVYDERLVRNGVMFIRIVNTTPYDIGCSLQDEYTFHTYTIHANTYGLWHKVYGRFQWQCD